MKKTRIFNGKEYVLQGIMSKKNADEHQEDYKLAGSNARIIKTVLDGHVRYAVYKGTVKRKEPKCPKCGSRDTEDSWGSEGYRQCNKCGKEF
jgi:hypothetical protein